GPLMAKPDLVSRLEEEEGRFLPGCDDDEEFADLPTGKLLTYSSKRAGGVLARGGGLTADHCVGAEKEAGA
ncbi:UNVERIFIED_CONTAM: hypothetical protein K2H54_066111, partial [Gekko kuhli]